MRKVLDSSKISRSALNSIEKYHSDVVDEVIASIQKHRVVVIGMRQNPFVKKARTILEDRKLEYEYLEYGSYFSLWKPRLAIKLWSGWPTFPQVFVEGQLVGGANDLEKYLSESKPA